MVKKQARFSPLSLRGQILGVGILLALLLMVLLAPPAFAAGSIETLEFEVEEQFTMEVNAVGDAHLTDVLKYDRAFFNTSGFKFENYPFLLERRYRDYSDVREIENFEHQIDRPSNTITLSFDTPGRAYNEGDYWILYGFYSKPRFNIEDKLVFEDESTVNSEFTLWQNLNFKSTTYVKLPPAATNIRYDEDKSAVVYELPYVAQADIGGTALQRNKAAFIPIFSVLLVGGLAALALLFLQERRSRTQQPVGVAAGTDGTLIMQSTVTVSTLPASEPSLPVGPAPPLIESDPAPEQIAAVSEERLSAPQESAPASEEVTPTPEEATEAPPVEGRFCGYCGHDIPAEDFRFCPKCGKGLD